MIMAKRNEIFASLAFSAAPNAAEVHDTAPLAHTKLSVNKLSQPFFHEWLLNQFPTSCTFTIDFFKLML